MILREIVQERDVSRDIEAAKRPFRLVDDAMQGIEWTLCHKPEVGTHRSGQYWVYQQRGLKIHRIPEIVVLYSFTDEQVTLHAIMFRPAS